MTRETGELVKWFDDRGFGFIRRGGGEIYLHIKDLKRDGARPVVGDRISYAVADGKNGRPVAVRAEVVAAAPPTPEAPQRISRPVAEPILLSPRIWAAAILLALLAADIYLRILPVWAAALYLIAGLGSFWAYRRDKQAAGRQYFRMPERKLHLLDLTFGIIGGLLAQHYYRHKTYKPGYVMITAMIAALHVLILGFIFSDVFAPGKLGAALRALPGHLGQ